MTVLTGASIDDLDPLGVPLLPLQQDPAVTFQLIVQGGCWQSDFEPPALNTDTVFSYTAST